MNHWSANCHEPDEGILQHWKIGFGYQGEDDDDWRSVSESVDRHACEALVDDFKADIYFSVWGFRNDYAREKRLRGSRDNARKFRQHQSEICSTLLAELEKLQFVGMDFVELANPLKLALAKYQGDFLSKQVIGSKGRTVGASLGVLILTLADRWKIYTSLPPKGVEWIEFLARVLKVSGYAPSNRRGDGENHSDPGKLLAAAIRKHTGSKLYLREGDNARSAYIIGLKRGNK